VLGFAAFVVSLIALGVAGWSLKYAHDQAAATESSAASARQSASAAREATDIERGRRHDERTPRFSAKIEDVNGDMANLILRLAQTTEFELDHVSVELPRQCSFRFVRGLYGATDDTHAESYDDQGARAGPGMAWRVVLNEGDTNQAELLSIRVGVGDDVWGPMKIAVDVPYDVTDSVF
jgi:hypothetical protein